MALFVVGIGVSAWQPLSLSELLDIGYRAAERPLLAPVLVLVLVALFSLGLPGSLGLWVIAPFYPPVTATLLLLASSTGGALGAYAVSGYLSVSWKPTGISLRVRDVLAQRSDVLTQSALRILPGFPHAAVNFSAGALRLPLLPYLFSALLGLAIKWAVYVTAVQGLLEATGEGTALSASTIAPLIALSALLLCGQWARRWMRKTSGE